MVSHKTETPAKTKIVHTRIQPPQGWEAFNISELWHFRDLFIILLMRDVKLRYKQTILGVFWVILQPLASAIIFTLIFGRLARLPSNGVPYLLFAYAGMLGWNILAGALQRSGTSLVNNAQMISKVYFPRIAIPVASASSISVDFLVTLVVMFVLIGFYGFALTLNLLAFPFFVIMAFILTIGVSLWISGLSVYYRDFSYALPFLLQAWMYISPVVYSIELVPERYRVLYAINPMVGVIEGFRWSLLGVSNFPTTSAIIGAIVTLVIFVSGAIMFRRIENHFADVI